MTRRFAFSLLAAAILLVVIAMACSTTPILVATFECEVSDGGDSQHPCPPNQFCARSSCTSTFGKCAPIDSDGCAATGPECGCDGISYYNACARETARVTRDEQQQGACLATARTCAPMMPCPNADQSCAFMIPYFAPKYYVDGGNRMDNFCNALTSLPPGVIEMLPPQARMAILDTEMSGTCWSLPSAPPSSGARQVQKLCGDCIPDWEAIRDGGTYYLCPTDASAGD